MAERRADVGIRIKVDDRAAKEAKKIKKGFDEATESVGKVGSAFGSARQQAMGMFAALQLNRLVLGLERWARSTFHVATEAEQGRRHITAMLMAASGRDYNSAIAAGQSVAEELGQIAIVAGVSGETVNRTWKNLFPSVLRAGGGIQDAVDHVKAFAQISAATGMNIERMAGEMRVFTLGAGKATGPLAMMLKNFGELDITAKEFKRATEPERFNLLQRALGRVADQMAGVPPGFAQAAEAFRNIKDSIMDAFGKPMVEALTGSLQKINNWVQENSIRITVYARIWGRKFAEFLELAFNKVQKVFKWIYENWDRLMSAVKALPAIFGAATVARTAAPLMTGLARSLAGRIGGVITRSIGGVMSRAAPAAAGGAFNVVRGMTRAAPQGMFNVVRGAAGTAAAAAPAAGGGLMAALGGPQAIASIAALAAAITWTVAAAVAAGAVFYAFSRDIGGWGTRLKHTWSELSAAFGELWRAASPLVEMFGTTLLVTLNTFVRSLSYIVRGIGAATSAILRDPIIRFVARRMGVDVTGGAARGAAATREVARQQELARETNAIITERAQGVLARAKMEEQIRGGMRGAPTVDARGSTFHIKQDFRDQDPDRVAIVFQRDLIRSAESRFMARTSLPFGA